jgi:hypothetical protein
MLNVADLYKLANEVQTADSDNFAVPAFQAGEALRQVADALACLGAASQKDTAAMLSLAASSNVLLVKYQRIMAGLERLICACLPIDMWMGGLWANPPSHDERHEFVLALSAAMSLAQSVDTTSDSTQSPASPDDSAPSARTESEAPGSC